MAIEVVRVCVAGVIMSCLLMAQGGWALVSSTGPSNQGYGMAYDTVRGRTVLFGDSNGSVATWEWNGSNWTQVANAGPTPRHSPSMAFNSDTGRVVLFGGFSPSSGQQLADTWEWNGTSWTLVGSNGPSGFAPYGIAYDSHRGKMVLCGQYFPHNCPVYEWNSGSSTWVFTITLWAGCLDPEMVFDNVRGRTVLFCYPSGVYEWDGVAWALGAGGGPPSRARAALAYDSHRKQVVMFGGYTTGQYYADTWEYNGANWIQRFSGLAPAPQASHAMVYDSQRARTVLFGQGETWTWTGSPGSQTPFGVGCGTPPLSMFGVPASPPTANAIAQATLANIPSTVALVAVGWSNTAAGPFPLPVPLIGYGMPGCYMFQSADILGLPVTFNAPGQATYSLPIPNAAFVVGRHIYLQSYAVAPGANPAEVIVSNALDWHIGY
jgi:hypothetical protein